MADLFINRYKRIENGKSDKCLEEAFIADSLLENEKALKLYERSIDLNPDNAIAYQRRGSLKLTRLDLDPDLVTSAIKDLDRAIRLDSTLAIAYFHRSIAVGYLGQKGRSILDMNKVWELDSMNTNEFFSNHHWFK